MHRLYRLLMAALVGVSFGGSVPSQLVSAAPPDGDKVEVAEAVQHDVSPPLRGASASSPGAEQHREQPLRPIPQKDLVNNAPDPVVQSAPGPLAGTTNGLNFAGVGQGDYNFADQYAPPDTTGAVGATQYVQWVNVDLAVFDKITGAIAAGFPKPGKAIWAGFGGDCETNNDGDPIVQYDKAAERWVLTQFSVSTRPYLQCVAVSTTSDATGTYNRYAFSYGNTQFPDYPKLGVWPDGYYISYNIFNNGSTWAGSKVCAFDRSKMLAGQAATQQCFQLSTSYGGLLPSDLDGTTAPPAGSPNYFLNFGSNKLNLWKFHVDWSTPANTTFTGPTSISVAAFTPACSGGGACIPQPNTTNKLDSLADRLMYRLAYRNRGGVESLVVNQSVTAGSNRAGKGGVTSVRWYELRTPTGTPTVFQQGTLGTGDSIHRWMGSIAMDKQGNMALGYSASSSSVSPSIRYTGRLVSDTPGTMQAENTIQAGGGSQTGTLHRWGDYSAMTVDPVDDCTFWYTTEYLKANGTWNWSTRITSFKFPNCS
jgi:hypothetical protein